jgi:hypothetical protein
MKSPDFQAPASPCFDFTDAQWSLVLHECAMLLSTLRSRHVTHFNDVLNRLPLALASALDNALASCNGKALDQQLERIYRELRAT